MTRIKTTQTLSVEHGTVSLFLGVAAICQLVQGLVYRFSNEKISTIIGTSAQYASRVIADMQPSRGVIAHKLTILNTLTDQLIYSEEPRYLYKGTLPARATYGSDADGIYLLHGTDIHTITHAIKRRHKPLAKDIAQALSLSVGRVRMLHKIGPEAFPSKSQVNLARYLVTRCGYGDMGGAHYLVEGPEDEFRSLVHNCYLAEECVIGLATPVQYSRIKYVPGCLPGHELIVIDPLATP